MNSNLFTWDAEARCFHAEAFEIGWDEKPPAPPTISLTSSKTGTSRIFRFHEYAPAQGWLYTSDDISVLIFK